MVLSETVQFVVIFAVTTFFSAFALALSEDRGNIRIILKVLSSVCWITLSLSAFTLFAGSILLVPSALIFMVIGVVFAFTIVIDFRTEKHSKIWDFEGD